MILQIFSVKDKKVDAFLQPFFSANTGSALRSLMDVLDDPNHHFSKHAADFVLYAIGGFDDLTGSVSALDTPDAVVNLADLKSSMKRNT